MFRKEFLGFFIIILILSVGIVSASETNTTETLKDTIIANDSDNFQKIIDDANDNDIIEINDRIEPFNVINIEKNLTLQGANNESIIDYVTLNITKGDVTIRDLTFKYMMNRYVISAKNERLNLINCTFIKDATIEFQGKTLTLTDCTIKTEYGISAPKGNVEVTNCLFENIQGTSISMGNGNLILINSTLKDAYRINHENGQAIIKNNKFLNSGFLLQDVQATVEGNVFNASYPNMNSQSKSSFKNNVIIGAALYGKNIKEIADCKFISSNIFAENCYSITNCLFRDYKSEYFNLIKFSKDLHLTNCSFINNTCEMMLVVVDNKDYQINNCLFENNTGNYLIYGQYFDKLQIQNTRFHNNSPAKSLIYCEESKNINILSSEFKDNIAEDILIKLKEQKATKINSNVISNNICPNPIHISFLDYHIELNEKITTSIEMTNNIISTNHDRKNNPSHVFLSPKIASSAINMKWGTQLNLKNNFYGYNFISFDEFKLIMPIKFEVMPSITADILAPANLELVNKNTLQFVDSNGKAIKMPKYTFSIKNKTSNEILVSSVLTNDGKGIFTNNKGITSTNSLIINEGGKVVNKQKVTITIAKKGNNYNDFSLEITLKYRNAPIANQNVHHYRYVYSKSGKLLDTFEDVKKTDKNGKITFTFFPTNFEEEVDHYAFKVKFTSEDYALSQKTLKGIKINKIKTTVKAPKVTNKYKKAAYFKLTVKSGKNPVKNTYVKVKIDSKTYKIKTNSKGIAKCNTKSLKVGKHNVVVSSGDSKYLMSAKSTITIKR